ncbi:MAG TPA: ATP-binding cassette domain-containing protein, partial [Thermomicrobiales bacterium]|nr:ATP-binding cassette domain-containing protein [Thermomicrobiales bacterium]
DSGSGKSTFLRALNGLVPHFSGGTFGGVVRVGGLDTRRHPPRELSRIAGFVFQDPEAQMVTDRVDDEIAFSLEQHGIDPLVMRKRVEEMLDVLGIVPLRHRSPATLSGGERQRVAVASALALHPRLLLLDEPTSQLDPWGAEEVLTALRRLNEELGLTIVMAEHRLERTLHHADLVLKFGAAPGVVRGTPRGMAVHLESASLPPVTRLGLAVGSDPVPLTVKEGRGVAAAFSLSHTTYPGRMRSGPAGASALELEGITVELDRRDVLKDLSLTIGEGEIVALMGRNGSGKSTLLRTMLGLEQPRKGRLRIGGVDRTGKDPAELRGLIGYVPQRPDLLLYHELLGDELRHAMKLRGIDGPIEPWLARLGLGGMADRHPRDLSGGERERAAIATVLAAEPRILLLDEPTRGMDARHKVELMSLLAELAAEGKAIVIATHDVELVAWFASRVVLLGDREIVADGPPRKVLVDSLTFTTQMNTLFGGEILTVEDVLARLPHPG